MKANYFITAIKTVLAARGEHTDSTGFYLGSDYKKSTLKDKHPLFGMQAINDFFYLRYD